ncbi:TetR/AcrR family transcriptional regulator [Rubrolithibacter danxiaensis]|uniref:TetR/AcrR family transcriptional regulator n=1 Tax=Rubrolithibacter danxiaensis TaxID=3390805 RepID=UPI003BF90BCD
MTETDRKRESIIEGAIKRFSHFGINKTTMAEIAEDLSVSKPALYYYFPDKQSVIIAVAEKIISEYLKDVENAFLQYPDTEEALIKLLNIRREFFQNYFMLHMGEEYSDAYLKDPGLILIMKQTRQREVSIVAESFRRGMENGQIKKMDAEKTAALLLDTLMGLRVSMRIEQLPFPDKTSFEELLNKQKDVARIFLNGIKK